MSQNRDIEVHSSQYDEEVEIDLLELFSHYLDNIKWVAGAFVLFAIAAAAITVFAITPKYTATSKMYMVSSSSQSVVDLTDLNFGQSISSDYVELLQTRPIIEGVVKEQKLDYTYKEMLELLNISVVKDTRIIRIDATSVDKREAMIIANALADKGASELPKLMETPEPHIAEYAIVPVNRSSPSLAKNTMLGALIGMLLVLSVLTVQFLLDDTFKTAEDIQKEFGVMPLTVIPEGKIEGIIQVDETETSRGLFDRYLKRNSKKKEYKPSSGRKRK